MSAAAILSIKPTYANQILAGTKTIELRKSSMGLTAGDVVLVYSSAPEQRIALWFEIKKVKELSVAEMWMQCKDLLGIDYDDYLGYFNEVDVAVGLHIGEVHPLRPISLRQIEELVPGFVPPQGLIWLRDEIGRFERLLGRLSTPLPSSVFPQQSLTFDV
jgi:predicted transcriptional regulator